MTRRAEWNLMEAYVQSLHLPQEIPVDVEGYIASLPGKIQEAAPLSHSSIHQKGETWVFSLRFKTNRRVLAQMVGYYHLYIMGLGWPDYIDAMSFRPETYTTRVHQASAFACAMLMPSGPFEALAGKHLEEGTYNLGAIAEVVCATPDDVRFRGQALGIFDWMG